MTETRSQQKRSPELTEAWILGSGTASLASALYLVQNAKISASQVHVFDPHISMGQVLHNNGDPHNGYDQFAGCLPVPVGKPLKELLASVPSVTGQGQTTLDDIQKAEAKRGRVSVKGNTGTRFLVQKNRVLHSIPTKSLGLSSKHRLALFLFMLKKEKYLGRNQIRDFLPSSFFQSSFWAIWSAQYVIPYAKSIPFLGLLITDFYICFRLGFQPWHSATEFRRAICQYVDEFNSLNILKCLDITGYYQHEAIFLPVFLYLESLGVDFHFDAKITDILTHTEDGQETVSQLGIIENGFPMRKTVGEHDLVIITLGSTVSGSATGTNDSPPGWHSFEPDQELDENWSLWLDIGTRDPKYGNPYNFCTREAESMLESFTITTKDQGLFNYLNSLAQNMTEAGGFIALQESPWRLSFCIPTQPVFSHQPNDIRVLWGFALSPERKGDYVKKPMFRCSGAEVTTELLAHLNFSSSSLQHTMTIPRVMPRMSSLLLARSLGDRPQVIPHNTLNVGLVGQFVEIPQYSCVDTSYGVRAAQVAVSQLMGLHAEKFEEKGPSISTLLNILFRK